jgi:acyl-CoA synthetase (AMP-forming)/AMP-acid ligase II
VFTSGTKGDPKLCFHTHGDPGVFEQAIGSVVGITPDDVTFSVSRMYFAYGLGNSVFLPLHRGGATVLSRAGRPRTTRCVARQARTGRGGGDGRATVTTATRSGGVNRPTGHRSTCGSVGLARTLEG